MAWYNSSWLKRKAITLTGGSSGTQTDYQVKLSVTYDSDMKSDFSDIRFTEADGTTSLEAWLESKIDDTSAIIWVKSDTPANTVTADIYMYYGNSTASSDWDFDNTFIFGDPFDSTTLNTSRWTSVDGSPSYSVNSTNHYLEVTDMGSSNWNNGRGFHSKTLTLPTNWIAEEVYGSGGFGMYHNTVPGDVFTGIFSIAHTGWSDTDYGVAAYATYDYWASGQGSKNIASVGGNADYDSGGMTPPLPVTYDIKMWKTAGNIHITEDGTERVNEANSETPDRVHFGIGRYSTYTFGTKRLYAFKIRKYAANPATYGFGSEESAPSGNAMWYYNLLNRRNN